MNVKQAADILAAFAEIGRLKVILKAIVDRAENGDLGSSKVQDMKKLALEGLEEHDGI